MHNILNPCFQVRRQRASLKPHIFLGHSCTVGTQALCRHKTAHLGPYFGEHSVFHNAILCRFEKVMYYSSLWSAFSLFITATTISIVQNKRSFESVCLESNDFVILRLLYLPDARFITATINANGLPGSKRVIKDENFQRVAYRNNPAPIFIDAKEVSHRHHLELSLRIPPFPRPLPPLAPYQMAITLEQPPNYTVCDTPGLGVFTSDA